MAQELQDATDRREFKSFYQNLTSFFGSVSNGSTLIFSSEGKLLKTKKKEIIKCWAEHFSNFLNMESNVDKNIINNFVQRPILEGRLAKRTDKRKVL